MDTVLRSISKRVKNKERLWVFRAKLMRLYEEFEAEVEALCREQGVEVNFWYNPSTIPQPKFVFDRIAICADTLYDEEKFSLLCSPKITVNQKKTLEARTKKRLVSR
jgi:hypothetical protein